MKTLNRLKLVFFVFTLAVILASCESDLAPAENEVTPQLTKKRGKNNKKDKETPTEEETPSDTEEETFTDFYTLSVPADPDALISFAISDSGNSILLESTTEVGTWGSDFYGYWSEPLAFSNNEVTFTIGGLSHTTYSLSPIGTDQFQVTRTVVQDPYLSGPSTTTITDVGIFQK